MKALEILRETEAVDPIYKSKEKLTELLSKLDTEKLVDILERIVAIANGLGADPANVENLIQSYNNGNYAHVAVFNYKARTCISSVIMSLAMPIHSSLKFLQMLEDETGILITGVQDEPNRGSFIGFKIHPISYLNESRFQNRAGKDLGMKEANETGIKFTFNATSEGPFFQLHPTTFLNEGTVKYFNKKHLISEIEKILKNKTTEVVGELTEYFYKGRGNTKSRADIENMLNGDDPVYSDRWVWEAQAAIMIINHVNEEDVRDDVDKITGIRISEPLRGHHALHPISYLNESIGDFRHSTPLSKFTDRQV